MIRSYNSSLSNIALKYLKYLNIPCSKGSIKETLEYNPYYPSLYSLSETFNKLKISNKAFKASREDFNSIETPFVVFLNKSDGNSDFALVTQVDNQYVTYILDGSKNHKVKKADFFIQWKGIIFIAEKTLESGDPNYKSYLKKHNLKKVREYSMIILGILLLILSIFSVIPFNVISIIILLLKFTGLTICVLLLIYDIDKTNIFIKNICTSGKKTNCDAVLNSKVKGIFGITWSEIGFFYFASSTIFFLYPSLDMSTKLMILMGASVLASPYIIFSLYYQWRIVKQWCVLCLTIQGILFLELLWSLVVYQKQALLLPTEAIIIPFVVSIILPILLWFSLKNVFFTAKNAKIYEGSYRRLLYNPEIFNSFLSQQNLAPEGWQELGILVGNPSADHTILKICNPYCGPCAEMHPVLEEVIFQNQNINLRILFTTPNNKGDASLIAKHLLSISRLGKPQQTTNALDFWYLSSKKDYKKFKEQYPLEFTNEMHLSLGNELEKMHLWCKSAEVTGTPTIYVNSRLLPEMYEVKQLKNILC